MRILQAVSILAITSSLLASPKTSANSFKAEASSNAFTSLSLNTGEHVRIESDGAPFYISLGKNRTSAEMARFSYILDEASLAMSDLDKAGIFVTNVNDVASTYSGKETRSFQKEFQDAYANSGSVDSLETYVNDRASYMFNTGALYSLIFFKGSETAQTNAILRNGVLDYTQGSLGMYEDSEGMDGCFGYYFDGAHVTLSFLNLFTFGTDLTLYYQEGVNVIVDKETVQPTLKADDYEIFDGSPDEAGTRAVYNRSLCYIPLTQKPSPEDTLVEYDHIEVNGVANENLTLKKDGTRFFLVGKFNDGDEISIITNKTVTKEDKNVVVHDLYDVSGSTSLSFSTLYDAATGIGNIPNETNNAFRFVLNSPSIDGSAWGGEAQTKFGIWISNSGMWSNFGYIIRFQQGSVTLMDGEEIVLASGESSSIVSRSSFVVVVGLVKVYNEANHWFANRLYVEVNGSRVASYDDLKRRSLGSVITAPYIGMEGGEVSFEDYRKADLLSVEDVTSSEHVHADMGAYVLSGQDLNAAFCLDEGYKFVSFNVNGEDALSDLAYGDGLYTLKISNVSSRIQISYTLVSDVHIRLGLSGDIIDSKYDNSPLYGSKPVVSFSCEKGKVPSSVKVNGEEALTKLTREGKVYTLALNACIEDVSIVVEAKDASYHVTASASSDGHANISVSSNNVLAGGGASFSVSLEDGYLLENVSIEGEATMSSSSGVYFLDDIYSDVSISVKTRKEESQVIPSSNGDKLSWLPIALYSLSGASLLAAGAAVAVLAKKKKGDK